jgi:hypothetical protein
MEAALQESYVITFYQVHKPMLCGDSSAPASLEFVSQWFGFPYALEWIGTYRINESVDSFSNLRVRI